MFNKKGFTLVELIVVITIISILGTIAFINLQGYNVGARDTKRISDINSILNKVDLEQIKGESVSDIIDNKVTNTGIINNQITTIEQGITNFTLLKEDGVKFRDPKTKGDYILAYSEGSTDKFDYKFTQISTVSEETNLAIVRGNYTKIDINNDSPSIVKSSSGLFIVNGDIILPYEVADPIINIAPVIIALDKPDGLLSNLQTDTGISFSWNSLTGATQYGLHLNGTLLGYTSSTGATINGLTANTNYDLSITGKNSGTESVLSDVLTSRTAPPPPTIVNGLGSNESQIGISRPSSSEATGYAIYNNGVLLGTLTGLSATLNLLPSNTIQNISVSSIRGTTAISAPSTILAYSTAPGIPTNFKKTHNSNNSISLSWDSMSGAIGYDYYIYAPSPIFIGTTPNNFAHFEGLSANSTYKHVVRSRMSANQLSNVTPLLTDKTAPTTLGNITNLTVTSVGTGSVTMTWDIMPTASKYYAYMGGMFMGESLNNTENIFTSSGLLQNTTYPFRIVGVTGSGSFGNFSGPFGGVTGFGVKNAKNVTTLP
ncbi:MAG: prepilin-type N-terminal cleavage/methylation domain-containing protein [Candidatus Gracilibacteria bacterium]|nr:prepilin-type N-terminal cleavage/methylation domain-containing protein [Candidatus Gracilibacteria bacterium]